jgi:hypothetical protein
MDESLFEGPALPEPIPASMAGSAAWYEPLAVEPRLPPMRHLRGYAPFLEYLSMLWVDPGTMARDPLALTGLLCEHHRALAAHPGLVEAAAVFLGNALVAARADAEWRGPDEVAGPRDRISPLAIVSRIGAAPQERLDELHGMLLAWTTAAYSEPLAVAEPTPPAPLFPYVRPPITGPAIVPALTVAAKGLAAHLLRNYAVATHAGLPVGLPLRPNPLWTVRLLPATEDAAPLTLAAYDDGVHVVAGVLHTPKFPESNQFEADLRPRADGPCRRRGQIRRAHARARAGLVRAIARLPDGSRKASGAGRLGAFGPAVLDAARTRLKGLPNNWQPWPLRQ